MFKYSSMLALYALTSEVETNVFLWLCHQETKIEYSKLCIVIPFKYWYC